MSDEFMRWLASRLIQNIVAVYNGLKVVVLNELGHCNQS